MKYVVIGTFFTYAVLCLVAAEYGKILARYIPGPIAYISHQGAPFGWSYSYESGDVGPFHIGDSRIKAIDKIIKTSNFQIYSFPDKIKESNDITNKDIESLKNMEKITVAEHKYGTKILYTIEFKDDMIHSINMASNLLEGL